MKRVYINIIALLAVGSMSLLPANAQSPADAYRNVQQGIFGTARAQGLGGAVGAMGADPTAVYVNPAGSALYLRSSLSVGFDVGRDNSKIDWIGSDITTSVNRELATSRLSDLSYFSRGLDFRVGNGGALRLNFGVSFSTDFNYKRDYEMNTGSLGAGITDLMVFRAMDNGDPLNAYFKENIYDAFLESVDPVVALGVNGELIEGFTTDGSDPMKATDFRSNISMWPPKGYPGEPLFLLPITSQLNVSERGSRYAYDFNMGLGYNDILYFGASLNIGTQSFSRSSMYKEAFYGDVTFHNPETGEESRRVNESWLEYGTNLDVSGGSIGVTLGVIAAMGDYGRLGISYRTPQYGQYKELYSGSTRMKNDDFQDNTPLTFESGEYRSSYGMFTPGQLTVSALAFLSRFGFVTYDFQYRNLGHSRIMLSNTLERSGASDFIKEDYGAEYTHRVGLEIRPLSWLSARLGYMYSGNPMKAEPLKSEGDYGLTYDALSGGMITDFVLPRDYQAITGGLGFNIGRNLTIDVAYVHETRNQKVYPFTGYTLSEATTKKLINRGELEQGAGNPAIAVKGGDLKEVRGSFVGTFTIRF